MTASFKHLRDLHKEESGLLLKSGYGLTSKALNPSNLERQDVKLVLQVFNPHVAEALTARSGEVDLQHAAATADFIRVILRWWSIVNVKTPNKGYHHRNVYEEPMADHTDDPKARFLSAFITWLDVWEFYRHDTGVLTQETLSALRLSAQSLLALVKYCVSELHFKYVLLGKVQTDPLESRFGQYRQMAGGQYHISVRQLCETEGRIRLQNALPRMSSDDLKGIEEVHVTDVGTSCSVEVHDADLDQLRAQMPVIGYVGGYCAHAAIKVLKCKSCQGHLVITANEAETEEDSHSLITKLDRGNLKRVLAKVGLPSGPYSEERKETYQDVAIVLGNVMRNLDLKIFFAVDFVPDSNSKANAPFGKKVLIRKVPHYGATKERRRDNVATEKCEYAYCMLKTPQLLPPHGRLYNYVSIEFYTFIFHLTMERLKWTEEEVKKSPTLAELEDATKIKNPDGSVANQGFNWTLFLNTLLRNTKFKFSDSTTVFVEDYAVVINVMKLVQKASRNVVLNYIFLEAWSFISPLLPANYLHNVRYLPNTDFVPISQTSVRPNCFKLAEIFCPQGMTAVIKQELLRFPSNKAAAVWVCTFELLLSEASHYNA
ncbi:hypothetical protein HPB50_000306 [Hyalomma asiaticum]|uniref:Uncharacterized protein n=1 Tax=Hyalomma asiaticum TaxID=266040 RepID=A0ACB7RUF5_HYAAI|nr:hypothetical protein HPB50_000306 [Hyalomma asiaticum]